TVLLVIAIASRLDSGFRNHTIILFGMIFSLFVNACMTMLSALNKSHMQRLILWQMGSFSGRRFGHVAVIFVCVLAGTILIAFFHRELDILSFGDEEAAAVGVDQKKTKILLLILASFLTVGMPQGMTKSGGQYRTDFPEEATLEVKYAVLSWYADAHAGDTGSVATAVRQERDTVGAQLFRQWSETLLQRGAPLVRIRNNCPELFPAVFSQTLGIEQGLQIIDDIQGSSPNGIEFEIPVEMASSPAIWRHSANRERQRFQSMARERKTIKVADPPGFDRQAFNTLLVRLKAMLESKSRILALCDAYEKAAEIAQDKRLDYLKKLLDSFTEGSKSLPDDASFELIGDSTTLQRFYSILAKLPERCIEFTMSFADSTLAAERERLRRLGASSSTETLKVLASVETEMSVSLVDAENDDRFKATLSSAKERIDLQAHECASLRTQLWKDMLNALDGKREYWGACREFNRFIKELHEEDKGQYAVYFTRSVPGQSGKTLAELIRDELATLYMTILGHAYTDYFWRAEDTLKVNEKYGVSFAISSLLVQMSTLPSGCALSEELGRKLDATMKLRDEARAKITDKVLRRTISIADMTSDVPGIGLTYSRDLENELKSTLKAFGMERQVVFPENVSNDFKWNYVVFDGRVANFDGNELTERQATHSRKLFGEGRRVDNPAYDSEAPENAPKEKRAKVKYLQDENMMVIHVKEVERLAHLRIFMNFRGIGVTKRIEVNEFYSRKFSIEESHPFDDMKKIATHEYYDAMSVRPVTPEPTLRYDRIWTAGEMLDWARKDSLKLASLKLFYYINAYPLNIQDKVNTYESSGKKEEALEAISHCLIQCQLQDSGSDAIARLSSAEPPAAKEYESTLAMLNRQISDIAALKDRSAARLLDLANAYLLSQSNKQ
ncbi:MAG: iron chelate uptake ABC transporter family permease subunit, partial [Victivallales bacterium]|nr:iron chelate uptake ABC transporter family permease subunit [Victivallales bacterium]